MTSNSNRWYNDDIGNFIEKLPISSNILESYDNVTYNASLYMFPSNIQSMLEEKRMNNKDFNQEINRQKKLIIAQTGLTTKFNITSFTLKSVFGNNTMESNILTYECNINVEESLGCNFSNEFGSLTNNPDIDSSSTSAIPSTSL